MVSNERMYSSFSGLPKVLLALLLVLRFPGENATELPAAKRREGNAEIRTSENRFHIGRTALS